MATFGERLRELRKEKGKNQEELAKIFFITKSSICKYEKDNNFPSAQLIQSMSDYFGVSVDYLLGKTDKRNENKSRIAEEKANEILEALEKMGIDAENIDMDILKIILESYKVLKKK